MRSSCLEVLQQIYIILISLSLYIYIYHIYNNYITSFTSFTIGNNMPSEVSGTGVILPHPSMHKESPGSLAGALTLLRTCWDVLANDLGSSRVSWVERRWNAKVLPSEMFFIVLLRGDGYKKSICCKEPANTWTCAFLNLQGQRTSVMRWVLCHWQISKHVKWEGKIANFANKLKPISSQGPKTGTGTLVLCSLTRYLSITLICKAQMAE